YEIGFGDGKTGRLTLQCKGGITTQANCAGAAASHAYANGGIYDAFLLPYPGCHGVDANATCDPVAIATVRIRVDFAWAAIRQPSANLDTDVSVPGMTK